RQWLSVCVHQHTQDVRGCPWLSVNTHRTSVCVSVCPSAHTGRLWLSISIHISTFDIRGCPCLAHTGRPWLSVCVRVCPCVFVYVRQHRQEVHRCPSAHTGRPWLSISTHISKLVLGLSMVALSVDCLGNFVPRGLSVQYTQDDVRGCPSAHTGHPWVSVSTHRTSVAVCV
ncbi:unnamed protein product, partial [Brassica rapa]